MRSRFRFLGRGSAAVRGRADSCEVSVFLASGFAVVRPKFLSEIRDPAYLSPSLAKMSYEGKEVRCEASAEARIDLQQKRLPIRHFVIHAANSLELDRQQYPCEQIQIRAAMNDSETLCALSFDGGVVGKFILDVQSLDDSPIDKQDVRGELGRSRYEFLAEVIGIRDPIELRSFIFAVTDDVTVLPPRSDTPFEDVWGS